MSDCSDDGGAKTYKILSFSSRLFLYKGIYGLGWKGAFEGPCMYMCRYYWGISEGVKYIKCT